MGKKIEAIIILAGLVIAAALYLFVPKEKGYSDEPSSWVEEKTGGTREININKATKGAGYLDSNGLQYETLTIGTVFAIEGWYKGEHFNEEYKDSEGRALMRITNNMKPFDGVPEGFIIEKIENEKPIAYIFLDDDWRKNIGNTTIFWGSVYENEKAFNFSNEAKNGVFVDVIEDDAGRFENNYNLHSGGIWVGELRDEESTIISLS